MSINTEMIYLFVAVSGTTWGFVEGSKNAIIKRALSKIYNLKKSWWGEISLDTFIDRGLLALVVLIAACSVFITHTIDMKKLVDSQTTSFQYLVDVDGLSVLGIMRVYLPEGLSNWQVFMMTLFDSIATVVLVAGGSRVIYATEKLCVGLYGAAMLLTKSTPVDPKPTPEPE